MKLRNKLLLSCAALAACATTMVSTTFAWYTSNTEVKATGVTGSSAEAGSNLLLISADGTNWATSVDLTKTLQEAAQDPMTPLAWSNNYLQTFSHTSGELSSESSDQAGYLQFDLYFKLASTNAEQKLYVQQFAITNETKKTALPSKNIIGDHWSIIGTGDAAGHSTYQVNALRVLKSVVEVTPMGGASGSVVRDVVDLSTLNASSSFGDSLGEGTSYDAHKYLKDVMNKPTWEIADTTVKKEITATDSAANNNEWTIATLPTAGTEETKNQHLKVTFKLFLDGADKACFDACQGQEFSVQLAFTTDATKALTVTDTSQSL